MVIFDLNKSQLAYFVNLYKLKAYFVILNFPEYVIIGYSVFRKQALLFKCVKEK